MDVTGFSVSVLSPISDTLTFTGGSVGVVEIGVVVLVACEKMGGGKRVVEIGTLLTGGGGGTKVMV